MIILIFFEISSMMVIISANNVIITNNDEIYEVLDYFQPRGLSDISTQIMNWMFIMPGTNWCGVGDKADNYDDLGKYEEEDSCCRTHDHCPDFIMPFTKKYGLFNSNGVHCKLNCECDLEFFHCLSKINSSTSNLIGNIYFNTIGTECFKLDYPIIGCNKYSVLPAVKCISYRFTSQMQMHYQWFDVPNYPTKTANNAGTRKLVNIINLAPSLILVFHYFQCVQSINI